VLLSRKSFQSADMEFEVHERIGRRDAPDTAEPPVAS